MGETSDRLRKIRKELRISQGTFADRLGLKQGTYSDIENEKEVLTPRNIKLICLEFGINENWLLTGKGEMLKSGELTLQEKELLEVFDKLELEGQKEVQKYAEERLDLQNLKQIEEREWEKGAKSG